MNLHSLADQLNSTLADHGFARVIAGEYIQFGWRSIVGAVIVKEDGYTFDYVSEWDVPTTVHFDSAELLLERCRSLLIEYNDKGRPKAESS